MSHYGDNVAAGERATLLYELITTREMDPKCTQLEKFSIGFVSLMKQFNVYFKPSERLNDQQMLTYYERYIRKVPRLRNLKQQMNLTDRLVQSQANSIMPITTRLEYYLSNTISLDGDYKKAMLTSKRNANLGMIYSGDMDPNDIWDMKIHAAQATPDILSSLGTASDINTLDINAAVMFNDEDQLLDEAVELRPSMLPMPLREVWWENASGAHRTQRMGEYDETATQGLDAIGTRDA
eukprot:scaffold10608_cov88-Skeletonema_marinoi.AAC.1